MSEHIRRARPGDETELTAMIHELAEFERASDQCTVTERQLREALFGDQPTVYAHLVEVDGETAAAALWFRNFSTWDGVAGVYLEDLYVRPRFRRRGLARKMLATLARECLERGYTRLTWAVLDWNVDAIALYDAVGGRPQDEWITYRVSGPELSALAGQSGPPPQRSSATGESGPPPQRSSATES
jgi:GNAT superfamily N-acetyltransferase